MITKTTKKYLIKKGTEKKNTKKKKYRGLSSKYKSKKLGALEKKIYDFYDLNPIVYVIKLDQKKPSLNEKENNNNNNSNVITIKEGLSYYHESFFERISKYKGPLDKLANDKYELLGKYESLEKKDFDKYEPLRKMISEGYARGVAQYISNSFRLKYRVSNAFCKLWEIYSIDKDLLPLKPNPHMFLVAEAPGQWIYSSNHYYKTKYIDTLKSQNEKNNSQIIWKANSLNPKHPINIKEFGNVFGDDYGFIRKYPENWLYGKDETGNIFSLENQKWYHDYAKQVDHFDLVTGDAGLDGDNLQVLQKLEFACLGMIASVCSIGSNCIMKHFTSLTNNLKESEKTNGFFVNYLYLYYLLFDELKLIKPVTSNPNSGEFYVIGKGFRGISEANYNKLLAVMDKFKENTCIFEKDEIPESFVNLIADFEERIIKLRIKHKTLGNKVIECMKDQNFYQENDDCKIYLDNNSFKKIHRSVIKNWIKKTKFTQ